jgi:phosphoribosylamine--glycine ligase
MNACIDKKLNETEIIWDGKEAVCVVIASGGYPGDYEKGKTIHGLDDIDGAIVFHAGTKFDNNNIVTNGGRVLGVCALAYNTEEARKIAYENVAKINFEKAYYRKDIAK